METIHLKTVDPISQELLRSASQQGIELPWERFEKLQPQDGFLRLGLSCPFGCMQGPCRIDPFGRGPGKGVCGLAADEMVATLLLRLCLQGTMEAMAGVQSADGNPAVHFSSALGEMVNRALSSNDQPGLSLGDISRSGVLLHRPSASYQSLLTQALRLSLLTLGFQEQGRSATTGDALPCTIGYATLANQSLRIGLSGQPSARLVAALGDEIKQMSSAAAQLIALGEWIELEERFLPIGCTSGESELLLSSGAIHLLVAGPDCDAGMLQLCGKMNIPVVTDGDVADAGAIVQRAQRARESRSQLDLFTDAPPVPENQVQMSGKNLAGWSGPDDSGNIALIGGSDTVHLPLGNLPVELAAALSANGLQLGGWGDAALWVLKSRSSSEEQPVAFQTLDNRQGPLLGVKALASAGKLDSLQGICFTGMKSCQELSSALGLAYLGCRVSVATPIPIQGSQAVVDTLSEMLGQSGGQLRHFDHPAQTRELSEWFMSR